MSRELVLPRSCDAPGHDRLADDLGRVVALVGDADELVAETDRADDLRGGRQERDDAHQERLGLATLNGLLALAPGGLRPRPREAISPTVQRGFSSSTAARAAALSVYQIASIGV